MAGSALLTRKIVLGLFNPLIASFGASFVEKSQWTDSQKTIVLFFKS